MFFSSGKRNILGQTPRVASLELVPVPWTSGWAATLHHSNNNSSNNSNSRRGWTPTMPRIWLWGTIRRQPSDPSAPAPERWDLLAMRTNTRRVTWMRTFSSRWHIILDTTWPQVKILATLTSFNCSLRQHSREWLGLVVSEPEPEEQKPNTQLNKDLLKHHRHLLHPAPVMAEVSMMFSTDTN